jgi:hypothetical protein
VIALLTKETTNKKTGTNVMESYQVVENSGTVHDKLATQEFSSEEVIS